MASESRETPITPNIIARLATAARYAITGVTPDTWFGPQQPLTPQAPPDVKGRQWDYPFGVNLNYTPRSDSQLSFAELRALADALPLLRTVIETRKDQIAALGWAVRPIGGGGSGASQRANQTRAFRAFPDRRHAFSAWLRMLLEDMLVIDAACLYPRFSQSGALWSLDVIDGATITPLIGEDGRAPDAFATLPHDWTVDQMRQLQDYFDAMPTHVVLSGRDVRQRQPPLKDPCVEWLARDFAGRAVPTPSITNSGRRRPTILRPRFPQTPTLISRTGRAPG